MPGKRITFRKPIQLRFWTWVGIATPFIVFSGFFLAVIGLFGDYPNATKKGALLLLLGIAIFGIKVVMSLQLRCPVCINPVITAKRCARSPKADKLFGSYTLRVIFSAAFTKHFRCQYCGERVRIGE